MLSVFTPFEFFDIYAADAVLIIIDVIDDYNTGCPASTLSYHFRYGTVKSIATASSIYYVSCCTLTVSAQLPEKYLLHTRVCSAGHAFIFFDIQF